MNRFPLPRDPKTIWGLLQDESPKTRLMFVLEKALNLFNLSATFSRHSDVPLPLMALRGIESITSTLYFVETGKKNTFLAEIAPVIFLQSNCIASSGRDEFVTDLMKYIQVDSYGICLHNKDLPLHRMYLHFKTYIDHLYGQELLIFMARYKFIIAIENGICSDYMTEKLWRAIEIGVVPIYYGSPLVRDWLPNNKSAILVEDFATPELLSQHLHYLLQNDTAYEEYLKHKTLGDITNQKLIDELTIRPYQTSLSKVIHEFECFVCQRLHDKKETSVNIVTKKHYDCMLPTQLTRSVNNSDSKEFLEVIYNTYMFNVRRKIDNLYEEILDPDKTPRCSNTSWDW
ncbi:alpha-(1,3)-fucosyltransferase 10-like [Pectinophora gossypiella]|uniref:alpha-(1,3)-fucosyltransferase 10-like n=1 Tax=Pectinophora gossypiella TaxID=13191 RepID=UPI00214E4B6B|nr:alpha-(1,3)-fucosyltransferase 10-like [Pectinophora gossypiella]